MVTVKVTQDNENGRVHHLFLNGEDVSDGTTRVMIILEGGKPARVVVRRRISVENPKIELPGSFKAEVEFE